MAFLEVTNLEKKYGSLAAVDDVSFEVEQGELLTLLGPSGCGKTTTLRLIAGLESSDQGEVTIGGRLVQSSGKNIFIEPDKRGFGMVFQSYAIWPHMTVFQNVAYPLVERKLKKKVIKEKVYEILEKVGLSTLEGRPATNLSGGQQQRVALARALVYNPEILLFDEPLSNLDAKLRIEMRNEIRQLQKKFGITSVYVTHDQEEAFALSDRIIVMRDGKIEQIGDQANLYFQPKTRFITQFIGQTNLITGQVQKVDEKFMYINALGNIIKNDRKAEYEKGDKLFISIRPEYIKINPDKELDNVFDGVVEQKQYLGSFCKYYIATADTQISVEVHGITKNDVDHLPREGEPVNLGFQSKDCLYFKQGKNNDQNAEQGS